MGTVRIQSEAFSVDAVLADLVTESTGGVTLYVGTVRGRDADATTTSLDVEAFDAMALAELERLRSACVERFGLEDLSVIHRVGRLEAGQAILVVGLAGRHRKETFAAVDWFMDRLKERVPVWKRELGPDGVRWVAGQVPAGARP